MATCPVVPEPPKGSRTIDGTGSCFVHLQTGFHSVVVLCAKKSRRMFFPQRSEPNCPPVSCRFVPAFPDPFLRLTVFFSAHTHCFPHVGQQPSSDVPAAIHIYARSGGNTAKWAPLELLVLIVQTDRRLWDPVSSVGFLFVLC